MKITKLSAENVKRLTAVEITPDGNLVVVGGKNGAGKSSVLDSIMYALAGAASIPSQPIRTGAKTAEITLELDGERKLTIKRVMGRTGGSLVVKAEDAAPLSSPQALLDSLCGKIAFDPLEFTRLKPREQMERLRGLIGLDFTEEDARWKALFDERTAMNRDTKALKAQLEAIPEDPEAPAKEVSLADLMAALHRCQEVNAKNEDARCGLAGQERDTDRQRGDVEARKSRITAMEKQLEVERQALRQATDDTKSSVQLLAKCQKAIAALVDEDTAEVEERIAASGDLNARVRAQQERRRLVENLGRLSFKADRLTRELVDLDKAKTKALETAAWPVDGLGFDDDGVTYNDLPFDQASSADTLKVSVAIGAALNPILRLMLIRNGSLLDNESLATIASIAEEYDLQLWIERVGAGEECSVVIRDGRVREDEPDDHHAMRCVEGRANTDTEEADSLGEDQ